MFSQLRAGLSDLLRSTDLPYTLIDPAGKYLRRSYGGRESLGFGFELVPLIYAGAHADRCIENLLRFLPEGSTLQIGQLYSEASSHLVDAWEKAQTDHNNHPLLRESIAQRAAFFRDTIKHGSLTGNALAHLRLARTYAFLSLPIDRNIPIDPAAATAAEMARQHTDVVREYFRALGMHGEPLNASEQAHLIACMHALLAKGLPAVAPSEFADPAALLKLEPPSCSGKDRFITIGSVAAATFTVYNDPTLQPHWTPGMLLGTAAKHRPLPPHPFWLWTLFHKAPGDATGETIDTLTALTVFCPTKQVTRLRNEMASLWAPSGIEVEQPADQLRLYQAALPHGFNSGSRSSLRLLRKLPLAAACRLAPIASEWTGHPIEGGGPLFATRGGQPASIDLWRSETTYNAALVGGPVAVGTSGASSSPTPRSAPAAPFESFAIIPTTGATPVCSAPRSSTSTPPAPFRSTPSGAFRRATSRITAFQRASS